MSSHFYQKDSKSALEAISIAQKIAFAPMLFQAALCLRDFGILNLLDQAKTDGETLENIAKKAELSTYSVSILLDMGLSGEIIYQQETLYFLSKVGYFLLHDPMTRVNMDFTQHVCYQGLFKLKESLQTNEPKGLSVFGDWETIYPALSSLPLAAKKSWFAYDHFYSDTAFDDALKEIFALNPHHIYDVGGNTGKWAIACCNQNPNIEVTIIDLPEQIQLAKENITTQNLSNRIHTYAANILTQPSLPNDADIWWLSQFLDCFSENQIVEILSLIKKTMKPNAKICILEIFWNIQQFEAAAFSLNSSSLYFTTMANGKSRFYHSDIFIKCIEKAGLQVSKQIDQLGIGHSLLICEPALA